ncbi:hypothetical protein L596_002695 [Steinernema carpocapsae]|uniref:MARVEL domain-containing protein n=2 Tax=Steinernema carpocapsae TaxID=34508 RepID=A0A4V6I7S4_STECR|nr:hypothetical protein L596_002695 [Steinernema carpocapsae]
MVALKSAAWSVVLIQLVCSCVGLIASLAIVCAQLQSTSNFPERQRPSHSVILACSYSFVMIFTSVFAMFGLTLHQRADLIPHIIMSMITWMTHFASTRLRGLAHVHPPLPSGFGLLSLSACPLLLLHDLLALRFVYIESCANECVAGQRSESDSGQDVGFADGLRAADGGRDAVPGVFRAARLAKGTLLPRGITFDRPGNVGRLPGVGALRDYTSLWPLFQQTHLCRHPRLLFGTAVNSRHVASDGPAHFRLLLTAHGNLPHLSASPPRFCSC